jgi:hypothetical protein
MNNNTNTINNEKIANNIEYNLEEKIYKKNFKKILINIETILYKWTNNNNVSGFCVYLFHIIICTSTFLYLFLGNIDVLFYFSLAVWVSIFILHFHFKGCILTKIERHLWNTNTWYGPWTLLFSPIEYYSKDKLSKNVKKNMFICSGIILSTFLLLKIVFYN